MRRIISIVLTQESGNTIHTSLFKFNNKYKWIPRLIYGTTDDEELFKHIIQKLDTKYDILMIHSSFNNMIPMYTGNLHKLLSMIISYCENSNITLAMPTFFYGTIWEVAEYYKDSKHTFNVNKTVSGMGLLTEIFRRTPNVKRSIHPSHSICALGALADVLTRNHHLAGTTFGEGTPFGEMTKYKTMLLGIGANYMVATQVHSAEDIMKNGYPINLKTDIIPVVCVDELGNTILYNLGIRNREYIYDEKIISKILKRITKVWRYKGIPFFLTQANVVTETVIREANQGRTIYKKINL